ncbi:MAG: DUF3696 domain-containing protein [Bacteroidetes bacterium]|nr:DUF3696 domain-containing protein [Bacteroidota bacterium]
MIKSLSLRNFKSWKDTGQVRLAPITALFGSNSSGKTSLLQMLLMLKQTVESPDRSQVLNLGDERSYVELGTFPELLFAHDPDVSLGLDITWSLPEELSVEDPSRPKHILFLSDHLAFASWLTWKSNGSEGLGRAVVEQMAYHFAGGTFGMQPLAKGYTEYELLETGPGFEFKRGRGRPSTLPPPTKCYGFPDQVRAHFKNAEFLSDFELKFEELFSRVFYLGPLREYPKRQYSWAGSQPADMGRRGEKVVDALLASREAGAVLSRGPGRGKKKETLEERVARWLKELQLIDSFEVRPITHGSKLFQVWVRRHPGAAEVLITDVGFGVSQILPVIALCYYAPEGSTLLLEQPEIHLHPAVQAGLADVFIDAIRTRGIQIILESHSEHLLRRLQRRVAEEKLTQEETAFYFCSMEDGTSRLTSLDVDAFGTILNWPQNFFGDEFADIEAMQRARLSRKVRGTR